MTPAQPAVASAPPETESQLAASTRLSSRNLVLVGMMGAGKSSIGKRLAEKLKLRFIDADAEIETAAGKTIPEIFSEHGEAYFREGEKRVIARLLDESGLVLATGGGAFMNAGTRLAIARRSISVWLKADTDILMFRVRKRSNRPLLKTADPEATMRALMEIRHPVYALADITVQSRDVAHDVIVGEILAALAKLPALPDEVAQA
jgi:shikimate kinase